MRILRWIVTLPLAVLLGYLAYLIGGTINNLTTVLFLGAPLDGWQRTVTDVMAHIYMGAAMVYSAVRIAPSAPRSVAIGTTALLLAFAGASLWSSIMIAKFYALPAIGGAIFGGLAALYATLAGEILPYGSQPDRLRGGAG
jgi:hypothetical protein